MLRFFFFTSEKDSSILTVTTKKMNGQHLTNFMPDAFNFSFLIFKFLAHLGIHLIQLSNLKSRHLRIHSVSFVYNYCQSLGYCI